MISNRPHTVNLKGLTLAELQHLVASLGEPAFRGKQLFEWLYRKEASTFDAMTSLSKQLRTKLQETATIDCIELVRAERSGLDGTTKLLFELADGKRIESVLIPSEPADDDPYAVRKRARLTLCVSTQVGCPLDCAFCATATMGFLRNLTAGEIIDQLFQARRIAGRRITNLVYMGMGEPLLNYDNVMKSIEILTTGVGIAARRITISTAGWADRIKQMADERRRVKLAVSLHSLDDRVRMNLMPITRKFSLEELIDAVRYYYRKTKLRVTYEYILFDGVNDRDDDLRKLIQLTRTVPAKVNIVPFHPIAFARPDGPGASLRPTSPQRVESFVRQLRAAHVTVFVRSSAGEDINAACGQLAILDADRRKAHGRTPRPEYA